MTITRKAVWGAAAVAVLLAVSAAAQPALTSIAPDQARFRLISEEGLATPDGKAYVPAVKIWTVQDRATQVCSLLIFTPSGVATASIMQCPPDPRGTR
jgi:hypothetical protein